MELLKCEPFPRPTRDEQAAIVRFLDYARRRIRRYIRAKQKLIKLLKEQKQAIIHRAVTRGLDPNVRLKPSGVDWLGDVPEHWEVLRGKYVGRLFSTPSVADEELAERREGQPMYLKVSDLGNVGTDLQVRGSALSVSDRSVTPVSAAKSCVVFPKRGGAIYTNKVVLVEGGRRGLWS
jgi:type I restriction enzyme S subunit